MLASSGCNVNKMAVDQMVPLLEQTRDDFLRGGVVDNARAAGPGLIALLNGLALASPENPELRALQAELNFSYGGFQGARGGGGSEWFISNLAEELDSPREFWFNSSDQTLLYVASDSKPPTESPQRS